MESPYNITSPYRLNPPPFCYPGTLVPIFLSKLLPLIFEQLNLIGTHTHENIIGEGGFERAQRMEQEAIFWLGQFVCKNNTTDVSKIIDGYFSTGATESNIMGIWIGRNYLRSLYDEPPTVMLTHLAHYSFIKACNLANIPESDVLTIKHTNNFEMNIDDLEYSITTLISKKKKNIIIILTAGTSTAGSIDPIQQVNRIVNKYKKNINVYIHIDAAFGGFTIPFLTDDIHIGFENSFVMSMAIDGHKMGQLPYPAGIFLCRKNMQKYMTTHVNYIRGHCDDTLIGSRTSIPAIMAHYIFFNYGKEFYADKARECIMHRDDLANKLKNLEHVVVHPYSKYVNVLPLEVDLVAGKIPDEIIEGKLQNYHLRSDEVEIDGKIKIIYKIYIMEHTFNYIDQFVHDLKSVIDTFYHNEL